jgi:hypothetical protein
MTPDPDRRESRRTAAARAGPRLPVWLAAAIQPLFVALASAQTTIQVPSTPVCSTCRIVADTIAILGDTDGPGTVAQQGYVALGAGGHFYVTSNVEPGVVKVFDPRGAFVRSFGRLGRGPGEYQSARPIVVADDRIFVFDLFNVRVTALSPDHDVVATHRLPFPFEDVAHVKSARFVAAAPASTRQHAGLPLHLYDMQTGRIVRSFGALSERVVGRGSPNQRRRIAASSDGSIWSAYRNRYRLERWDTTGRMIAAYERDTNWFAPWERYIGTAATHRPQPVLHSIAEDRDRRLWTLVLMAAEDWRPLPPARVVGGKEYTSDAQRNQLYSSMVEVLTITDGRMRVYASVRFAGELLGFIAPGIVAKYDEDRWGHPRYMILRLRVI